jgi:hypothetical protein
VTPVGPIPSSLPRDELLHYLQRGNEPLWHAVAKATTRYAPRRKRVVVTIEVDPYKYLQLLEAKPRRRR